MRRKGGGQGASRFRLARTRLCSGRAALRNDAFTALCTGLWPTRPKAAALQNFHVSFTIDMEKAIAASAVASCFSVTIFTASLWVAVAKGCIHIMPKRRMMTSLAAAWLLNWFLIGPLPLSLLNLHLEVNYVGIVLIEINSNELMAAGGEVCYAKLS